MTRDSMQFDVVIVGAGPAGLSAALRLRQLAPELTVCVLEKAGEIGAHILSGAVLEPRALEELLPEYRSKKAPIETKVVSDRFLFLTRNHSVRLPVPPPMHNSGNSIVSLGLFVRWLAEQATEAGVDIFPGFAAVDLVFDAQGAVRGVVTGDMGVGRDGQKTANYQPGVEIHGRQTLFAEGCRGSLTGVLESHYRLRAESSPQTYALGIKELWETDPARTRPGFVMHTIGWPLDWRTYGGSFLYHLGENTVAIGFVTGLDYANPYLSPYEEFQRFKHHKAIRYFLEGGKRIAYGARALNEGGWQSIPKLAFPGGCLIGCAAGFLNVAKIKGTHLAMKSGMLAAESTVKALRAQSEGSVTLSDYEQTLRESWVGAELFRVRNIRPSFRYGLFAGMLYSAFDHAVLRGRAPWSFRHFPDHLCLRSANRARPINYPRPDGVISFDRLTNLSFSGVNHEPNQPVHLRLRKDSIAVEVNLARYDAPEQRYCPAGVYEFVQDETQRPVLQINAQNCVHCKTCDIKDPTGNIHWVPPEGGGGPHYAMM